MPRAPRTRGDGAPALSRAGVLLFCAAVCLGTARPAAAGTPAWAIELGPALVDFDYAEYTSTGALIDREQGLVPGIVARVEAGAGRWSLGVEGAVSAARVDYEGRVQSTSVSLHGLPAVTRTAATFASVEAQVGAALDARRRLAIYLGAGFRSWDRDIRPTTVTSRTGAVVPVSGLYEEYRWGEVHGGVRWRFLEARGTALVADGRLSRTIAPRIAVRWGADMIELRMEERLGWRVGMEARQVLRGRWYAALSVHAERSEFGASPRDARTGFVEPDSETLLVSAGARVGARF